MEIDTYDPNEVAQSAGLATKIMPIQDYNGE